MLTIEEPQAAPKFALWALGFRPFFMAASIFAVLSMAVWLSSLYWGVPAILIGMPVLTWHAHEMVFGYSTAVIAGFLFTAVRNWTGEQTFRGNALKLVLVCWLSARVCYFTPLGLLWTALFDLLFMVIVGAGVAIPVIKVRQWRQLGVLLILLLLTISNALFYWGVINGDYGIAQLGLYGGFYWVIGLILVMGRRVVPFFIEKGVGYDVVMIHRRWLDIACLVSYVSLVISSLAQWRQIALVSAVSCVFCYTTLFIGWHTPGIWRKPLLWVLYCGMLSILLGFILSVFSFAGYLSPYVVLHSFAVGGVGLITMGMMGRVSLGHTGRSIHEPPKGISLLFIALLISMILRLFAGTLTGTLTGTTQICLLASQLFWLLSFLGFTLLFAKIWLYSRVDGLPG